MATASQMDVGLDEIASRIRDSRAVMEKVKTNASGASASLADIPADYAAVLASIDAIPANTTDAFLGGLKAKKAALAAEFTALKGVADAVAAANLG